MKPQKLDWAGLSAKYGAAVVNRLRGIFESDGSFAVTEDNLSSASKCSREVARAMLEELAMDGFLTVAQRIRCPFCQQDLTEGQIEQSECVHCRGRFDGGHYAPQSYRIYSRTGQTSRDVKWVVTIHGMNTQGVWQEEYTWRLARLYEYSVPVAIYKYGNIKVSPFIPGRRRHFTRRLIKNLKQYSTETHEGGYGDRPDVIAHSFGTWLLYKALLTDGSIKVGRVVLTGSIIPPNFGWKELIDSGQVQAVLCHHAAKDIVVRLAQYGISEAGPSGYRGFNDREYVVHKLEPTFGHSDFFSPGNLSNVIENVWGPFLSHPISALSTLNENRPGFAEGLWHPSRWRFVTRLAMNMILMGALLLCAFFILSSLRGVKGTWIWIWHGLK